MGSVNIYHVVGPYDQFRREIDSFIFYAYLITATFDVICLMISGILLFKISRGLANLERNKFEVEKQWFWSFLNSLVIMLITWITEIVMWRRKNPYDNFNLSIISDLIKILSAFNIFAIFLARENVKIILYEKYGVD